MVPSGLQQLRRRGLIGEFVSIYEDEGGIDWDRHATMLPTPVTHDFAVLRKYFGV